MPWVARVEPDHVEALLWNGTAVELQHLVHVLVVTPGEHEARDAAPWLVHAMLRAIDWVVVVRVLLEGLREHDGVHGGCAAHREGVADNGPLLQHPIPGELWQRHHLPEVVQQAHQMEPIVLWPLGTDALRRLEVVDAVRDVHVGIGVVDEVVQHLDHLHDGELALLKLQPPLALLEAKIHRLLRVHGVVRPGNFVLPARILIIAERVSEHVLALVHAKAGTGITCAPGLRICSLLALVQVGE
mmetsp:Transcript_89255/g.252503  ORF Transcript_89255/g.252503 Transcript_89255/m.252503 type:complete len:243 (+) Transcript_89255:1096-1824(+)